MQYVISSLTFCGSIIPIHIMTNLMMSNQGSWRMSRGDASTHCLTSSTYLYAGTHLSPSSCICNHPINPLNHTAIYPNPCLGEKCWWNIPNIGPEDARLLSCTQLLATAKLFLQPCCYAPARWSWTAHAPLAWPRPNLSMPRLTPPRIYALNVNLV